MPEAEPVQVSSSFERSISDDTTLSALFDSGDCDLSGEEVCRPPALPAPTPTFEGSPMLLPLLLRGLARPPRDCLPLPMLEVPRLFATRLVPPWSSSLLKSDDDLALARGADNLRLPLDDPVEEREPLLR